MFERLCLRGCEDAHSLKGITSPTHEGPGVIVREKDALRVLGAAAPHHELAQGIANVVVRRRRGPRRLGQECGGLLLMLLERVVSRPVDAVLAKEAR